MRKRSQKQSHHKFTEACVLSLLNGLTYGTSLPLAWIYWLVGVLQLVYKLCRHHLDSASYCFVFSHKLQMSLQVHKGCHQPCHLRTSVHQGTGIIYCPHLISSVTVGTTQIK